jgi:hypothetical protein
MNLRTLEVFTNTNNKPRRRRRRRRRRRGEGAVSDRNRCGNPYVVGGMVN